MRISKAGFIAVIAMAIGWPAAASELPLGTGVVEGPLMGLAYDMPSAESIGTAAPSPQVPSGTVSGIIRDRAGLAPIAAAQVFIPGTGIANITGTNGRYVLAQVPAGTVTIRVERLGYQSASQEITIAEGQTVELNFELGSQALALDQIVVTGTAGGTQRRAIGNVVDQISATSAVEVSPATSLNQLISQRSPGVQLQGQSGTVGAGAPIHIRGVTSLSLGATPIIFIDGVRMDSRHDTGPTQRGGSRVSRLDDINIEDIESIEIIKGPAAATLYGTEASNGVIQIVTKRGAEGAPQFDLTVRTGTHWLWNPEGRVGWSYDGNPHLGQLDSINLYALERDTGPWGDPFTYGSLTDVSGNVRGGVERIRYFASAGWRDQVGVIDYNWEKAFSSRLNVDAVLSEQVRAAFNLGYVKRSYRGAQITNATDHFGNLVWGGPQTLNTPRRGWLNAPPEGSAEVDARSAVDRTTASMELNYTPFTWLTNRLVVGLDVGADQTSTLYPRHPDGSRHWWGSLSLGSKNVINETNRVLTFDYGASANRDFSADWRTTSSLGFQYYKLENTAISATGTQMAAPPLTTVSAGAVRSGSESFVENSTVGVYFQQQVDWNNRVFVTGAVRADANSAFGAEFDAAIYPKFSATWVMHEEDFWPFDWVDQFRLRAAWGAAGQQPNTFDAVRLYGPITGFGDQPGLEPSAIGNPLLKPERSEELEIGFDAGFLDDRIQVVFTRYDRSVKDAMVNRPLPPSEGFSGSQIVNLGLIKAWGNEVAVNARVLDRQTLGWDVGLAFATMANRIESLGTLADGLASGFAQQIPGFSISDLYYPKVLSADFVSGEFGAVTNLLCDGGRGPSGREMGGAPVPCAGAPFVRWGHSQPTWTLNVNQTVSIQRVRLHASVDAAGGHWHLDSTAPAAHTSYCTSKACRFQDDPIFMSYRAIGRNPLGMYEAGFARLRELSASVTLPDNWVARVGANRGSLSVAGRNLAMLWTAQHGWSTPRDGHVIVPIGNGVVWDPEVRGTGARATGYQTTMPPLASGVVTLRFSF